MNMRQSMWLGTTPHPLLDYKQQYFIYIPLKSAAELPKASVIVVSGNSLLTKTK